MLTVDLVRRGARRHRDRVALVVGDRQFTYRQIDERANRLANVLISLGLERGSRVGLLVANDEWAVPLDFACLKAGVTRVPLNARLSLAEHQHMLRETDARLLVHGPDLTERAHGLATDLDGLRLAGFSAAQRARDVDLHTALSKASPVDPMLPAAPNDPVLVLYTSGTTGTLKAAVHTQASYAAIVTNILANLVNPEPDDVMLHAASLIHASGTFVLPHWIRGARSVVLNGFDPEAYVEAIDRHQVTTTNLVPTMLGLLHSSGALDGADLSSLATIVYGASPMPRTLLEQSMQRLGNRFVQYYGQTEAPLCQTVLDKHDHAEGGSLLGSCGQPVVDAEMAITDSAGEPVAAGETGEIRVRAPFAMAGYYQAPELNANTLTPDGWVRTRDLARQDERGYLYLVDRASDMIVTGGYNVYPREVEEVLMEHPAVAECAVVGAPDPTWIEAVTAFVAFHPGSSATSDELRDTVRARIARYKTPKTVHVVDTIPKSSVGKILRRQLRDPLWTHPDDG